MSRLALCVVALLVAPGLSDPVLPQKTGREVQFSFCHNTMKTIVFLAGLVAVALAGSAPFHSDVKTKPVDAEFVRRQKLVLELLDNISQINTVHDCFKAGWEYDVEANIENYTDKSGVEEFMYFYNNRINIQGRTFSVLNDRMREEAIALFKMFYYAKDFETFYKTAAWARARTNEGLFVYSFTLAILNRPDTKGLILTTPYEIYPYYFVNADVINKLQRTKMQEGLMQPEIAAQYGIELRENVYTILGNYSGWANYDNEEQVLSYFTEDVGLNTYYYYFHATNPFWAIGDTTPIIPKTQHAEFYFYFYQQLLARYYMNRLTSGLGEIPTLSWRKPVKTGYTPNMVTHGLYPFVTRKNDYVLQTVENTFELQFLESFEEQFVQYLVQGFYEDNGKTVELNNANAIEFISKYWEASPTLFKSGANKSYQKHYEIVARILLGASYETTDVYNAAPVALEQFASALRDPVFYQLYKRILSFFLQYKEILTPYTTENLKFTGVKINDVHVDNLITEFELFEFDASNAVQRNQKELKDIKYTYNVVQSRLNNKPFTVNIDIKSEVETDAIFKVFLGPKYDSNGHPISLEDNWMNFVELDWFKTKLTSGKNTIVRKSEDFEFYKDDSVSVPDLLKYLEQGKVPKDMSESFIFLPRRMMLPKGTKNGYPFQLFVIAYPYVPVENQVHTLALDNKPLGYPFDRQVDELYFNQPNMYFKDIEIVHEGVQNSYGLLVPQATIKHSNVVTKA